MSYKVKLSTKVKDKKLKNGSGIIVLEPDDYKASEVKAIKKKGYKVIAYLSIGTIEKERSFYNKYKKYKLKRLEDWPNEYYMDMTKPEWQNFLIERAKKLKDDKGFDGWWLDNLDVYEYNKKDAVYSACKTVMQKIKELGGYVMVNGGSLWLEKALKKKEDLTKFINGYTQEEVFSRITSYKGKGKFGKQTKDQSSYYKDLLKQVKKNGINTFLLEYTRDDALKKKIKKWCTDNKMSGRCISENVNL